MSVTRSYSIPDDVASFIDTLPKRERSKFVATTLRQAVMQQSAQTAMDVLESIVPIQADNKKSSCDLLDEARAQRQDQLLTNT